MTLLYADLETYSEVPISCGTHRYAEEAEVLLFAWAIDDEPVTVWDLTTGEPCPPRLLAALRDPQVRTVWHNSHFDRTVLKHAAPELYVPPERIHDTMVQAFAHALPGKLGQLCEVLGVPVDKAKDKAGSRLIQLFCKPRPKNAKVRRATRETHPEQWAAFVEYARLDVEAMRECFYHMPKVNMTFDERRLWLLDQEINDLGVAVDMELVHGAIAAVDEEQRRLRVKTAEMTGDALESTTKRDAMLDYVLQEYGIALPDLRASTVEKAVQDDNLDIGLRELLRVRLAATTTSTSKYKALQRGVSSDGRLRGVLQFDGAGRTGRWAGRLFQPQNLSRGTIHGAELDLYIEAVKAGCLHLLCDERDLDSD